jgi:hypothetical protein
MSVVTADHYPRTISQYVPNMEFAADVVGGIALVNFGSPAADDPNGILDDASATTTAQTYTSANWETTFDGSSTSLTSTVGMMDAPYGRALIAQGTAGSDHVITVIGRDYLGQMMRENLTLSGTNIIYGNKAFKYVDTVSVAAGATGDTFDLGWTDKLGLPYMAQRVLSLTEDNAFMPVDRVYLPFFVNGTDYAAGTNMFLTAPVSGYIQGLDTTITVLTAGANTSTMELGGNAVVGLSHVIADASAVGAQDTSAPTDIEADTSKVAQYDDIEITFDGTPTAGALTGVVTIDPIVFTVGDTTAAQTATTNDTRGTIQPYTACDGSIEYECRIQVNTADLHGIEQFNG